ncbi:MAG: hypothetical protein ACTH58_12560 [Marinomonas foliarum]
MVHENEEKWGWKGVVCDGEYKLSMRLPRLMLIVLYLTMFNW